MATKPNPTPLHWLMTNQSQVEYRKRRGWVSWTFRFEKPSESKKKKRWNLEKHRIFPLFVLWFIFICLIDRFLTFYWFESYLCIWRTHFFSLRWKIFLFKKNILACWCCLMVFRIFFVFELRFLVFFNSWIFFSYELIVILLFIWENKQYKQSIDWIEYWCEMKSKTLNFCLWCSKVITF